jgi:hypothetical protein
MFCANQGAPSVQWNARVRYGRNGHYTVRTFSDGASSGAAFGSRRIRSCDFDANMQPMAGPVSRCSRRLQAPA